jgi:hypothetical protein
MKSQFMKDCNDGRRRRGGEEEGRRRRRGGEGRPLKRLILIYL